MKKQFLQAAILGLFSTNLFAHGLHLFAQYDGKTLSGKAYYSDQSPAAETYFEVFETGKDQPIVESKTDKMGAFSLPISGNPPFKVVLEGEEGHRVEHIAEQFTQGLSSGEIALLREDIQKLKDKIYLHDILGGIGYIFGLFGVLALLRSKKGQA